MIERLSDHAAPGLLYAASFVAALAPWQEQMEWALKIVASLSAIAFGLAGFLVTRRRARRR